jgi:hypothetical protein
MKRFLALLGPLLILTLPALAQQEAVNTDGIQAVEEGEVEVDLDQEEEVEVDFATEEDPTGDQQNSQAVTELMPLPDFDYNAWALVLPLLGLGLLAINVAWRSPGEKSKKKR